jgi:multidrug resistance efflux pump
VKEVYAEPNKAMKKGEPLFQMDPSQWEQRVAESQADYDLTKDEFDRLSRARRSGAVSQESVVTARDEMRAAEAELEKAKYNLEHTTIVAPSDGYVVALALRPGAFIRLKTPVLTFVSSEEYYLVAAVNQRAARWVDEGDEVEVALSLYPGRVFPGVVDSVIWGSGKAQILPSGTLPTSSVLQGSEYFYVRLRLKEDDPDFPLRFGAIGLAAIYTGNGPDVFRLLRQLEIRSESWLNYLYNPF